MTGPDEGHVSPLDLPQSFEPVGSFPVRDKLQQLVARDLLGPWDGQTEQFPPRAMGPRERYLVGMLGPKHQPASTLDDADADAVPDAGSGVQGEARGDGAGELPEVLTSQNLGRIWASSMGLSFCVDTGVDALAVTASWGQYVVQDIEDDQGRKRTAWTRRPRELPLEVRLDGERDHRVALTAPDLREPGVYLAVAVRPQGARRTVELTLVNNQQQPESRADTAWLFQAGLSVTALDGAAPVFLPVDDPLDDAGPPREDPEELHLRLLYRDRLKFATGHNIAVHAHEDPDIRRAHQRRRVPRARQMGDDEISAAVETIRARKDCRQDDTPAGYPDLRTPEWEIFSAARPPDPTDDFALRRDPDGVPAALKDVFADVVQVERLREVRALVGFTRLDAPDPDDPELVTRAPLARSDPAWVPASDVRGEGIFLRLPEALLRDWEDRVAASDALHRHRSAYAYFRSNRYSDRIIAPFDPMKHWPGARYIALHTLSHLLIRAIALDCGYSCASLSERIYAGTEDDPRTGILIYTAVPDAEGTLGGLVSQAEPDRLVHLTARALREATRCSSDPLCAERLPHPHADFLHGAACHVCLFVSETTCERGNKFLDRRFVVPIDAPELALFADRHEPL